MLAKTTNEPQNISMIALRAMEHKIDRLPLLPQVLVRILQIDTSSGDYFDQIDRLAREDPPFTVRLLAIANSASSSPAAPVKTIKAALTRMGASTITNLVSSMAVQEVFIPSSPSQVALWRHAIRVAVTAETIAQMVPALKVDKDQAYLAGLLHDIGRFVMYEHDPDSLLKVDESHWHTPEELIEADVEVFKFTHSELGYLACTHWGLPGELAQIVRRHHEPLIDAVVPGSTEANILCIEIADRLDVMILEPEEVDDIPLEDLANEIAQKCLGFPEARRFVKADALAANVAKIRASSKELLGGLGMA